MTEPPSVLTRRRLVVLLVAGLGGGVLARQYVLESNVTDLRGAESTPPETTALPTRKKGFGMGAYGSGGYGG